MLLGAHESVAGGLYLALRRGAADGCRAVQIFTKSSNQWREPVLDDAQIAQFKAALGELGGGPVMAHTSYLINLAADDREVLGKSRDALVAEVNRCSALGIACCVVHPGAHLGAGDDAGLKRVVESLDEVHARTPGASARVVLENTAGQGTCVGHRFEHLGQVIEAAKEGERLGVCFDTQHAYAAGYDMTTPDGYEKTWEHFDRIVGVRKLCGFHLNDSKRELGSRVDRHEHIGDGNLGLALFWRLANDPRFASLPGVLETEPRDPENPYKEEVLLLNSLVGAPEPAAKPAPAFKLEPPPLPAEKKRGKRG